VEKTIFNNLLINSLNHLPFGPTSLNLSSNALVSNAVFPLLEWPVTIRADFSTLLNIKIVFKNLG